MLSRRSLLISSLGLSAGALAPSRAFAAQSPAAGTPVDTELASYLALFPPSVAMPDQAVPMTYGNAKLQAETLGFELPFDPADEEAQRAWVNGTYPVMLPSIFRSAGFMDGFAELTGFEIGQVFSGAEFGDPPSMVTAIRGTFDVEAVRAAQLAAGYQEVDVEGHSVNSLDEDFAFSPDNPLQRWALARLNNAAVLDDGTLIYAPSRDLMRAVLTPGATLEAQPLVRQALSALDAPLISGMLLGPGAFVPNIPLELLQPGSEDEVADFILAMRDQTAAPVVWTAIIGSTAGGPVPSPDDEPAPLAPGEPRSVSKFSLVYATRAEATTAIGQIEDRLANGDSVAREVPWTELFTSWSAVQGAAPATVLLTVEWAGVPRTFDLIFKRDIGFITG